MSMVSRQTWSGLVSVLALLMGSVIGAGAMASTEESLGASAKCLPLAPVEPVLVFAPLTEDNTKELRTLVDQMRRNLFTFQLSLFRAKESLLRDGSPLRAFARAQASQGFQRNVVSEKGIIERVPVLHGMLQRMASYQQKLTTTRNIATASLQQVSAEVDGLTYDLEHGKLEQREMLAKMTQQQQRYAEQKSRLSQWQQCRGSEVAESEAHEQGQIARLQLNQNFEHITANKRELTLRVERLGRSRQLLEALMIQQAELQLWLEQSRRTEQALIQLLDQVSPAISAGDNANPTVESL